MSRFFITGGAGLLGSHATKELVSRGHSVTVYDSFQQYIIPHTTTCFENIRYRHTQLLGGAQIVRGSTENKEQLRRALLEADPEYVIHLAALPLSGLALRVPEEALNSIVRGTVHVMDVLQELSNLRKFVYVSSSMAYGNFSTSPLPEHAEKDPIEVYGAMKLAGEIMVRTYSRLYGLPYVIVRPSAVYGPTDNNQRVVQALVERAIQGCPLQVDNPESTFLDFTYVADIARGLCLATLTPEAVADDFNITFGRGRSLAELVEILRRHFPELQVEVRSGVDGFRPERGTLDNTKARRVLGYEPETCLEEGVAHYLDYIKTNNQSIVKGPDRAESASSGATSGR